MAWEVRLVAAPIVLDELPRLFQTDELSFARDGDQLVLRSRELDQLSDVSAVRARAESLLGALSGMTRLVLGSDSGLKVGSVVHLSPDGKRNIFVQLEPAVIRIVPGVVTMTVTRRDGTTETRGPLQPAPEWLT